MLRFIKNLLLFVILLVIIDRLGGALLERGFYHQNHGEDFTSINLLDKDTSDIVILGSSRAVHHFIPKKISVLTGLTCYNGGRDNMGIYYVNACVRQITDRSSPRCFIIDIIPYHFLEGYQTDQKFIDAQTGILMPFTNKYPEIRKAVERQDKKESWKARWIRTYPFNSLIGSILINSFTHIGRFSENGYDPLKGKIDSAAFKSQFNRYTPETVPFDTTALKLLEETLSIADSKGVKTILCVSPFYLNVPQYAAVCSEMKKIAEKHHGLFLDYAHDMEFLQHPELFRDELHLNEQGAEKLTEKVYREGIQPLLK